MDTEMPDRFQAGYVTVIEANEHINGVAAEGETAPPTSTTSALIQALEAEGFQIYANNHPYRGVAEVAYDRLLHSIAAITAVPVQEIHLLVWDICSHNHQKKMDVAYRVHRFAVVSGSLPNDSGNLGRFERGGAYEFADMRPVAEARNG